MSSRTSHHYDVIVIGADLAGIVAATLAARRGKRVLILPQQHEAALLGQWHYSQHIFPLQTAPFLALDAPPTQQVFEELGVWQYIRRKQQLTSDYTHLVFPDQRIDLEPAMANWLAEVKREWPEHLEHAQQWELFLQWGQAADQLYNDILMQEDAQHGDGFWDRKFLQRMGQQFPSDQENEQLPFNADHPLIRYAQVLSPWLVQLSPAQLGKTALLRLAYRWLRGPQEFQGGLPQLRQLLLDTFRRLGGEVKHVLQVTEIHSSRGRTIRLGIAGKSELYGCEALVIACDPRSLPEEIGLIDRFSHAAKEQFAAITPISRRFVMHVHVDPYGISPALLGRVLASHPQVSPYGHGNCYLSPPRVTHEGSILMTITAIIPFADPETDTRERILANLDMQGVLPFIAEHIDWIYSPHDGRGLTTLTGQPPVSPAPLPLSIPAEVNYEVDYPPALGVGLMPTEVGLKNIFLASSMNLPGLGTEGEIFAGLAVASTMVPTKSRRAFFRSR